MENKFFKGLPPGKTKGFCEVTSGSGSTVVIIEESCVSCTAGECMMFKTVLNKKGEIVGRKLKNHKPEY